MLINLAIDERPVLSLTDEPTAYSQITREPFGMIFLLLVFHFDIISCSIWAWFNTYKY